MSEKRPQRCGNCAVWLPNGLGGGVCHLSPPTPVLLGMAPAPNGLAGIPGRLGPQPVIIGARPTTQPDEFCAMWQGRPVDPATPES